MKWMPALLPALLLAGCSRASMPELDDVPPTAQASGYAQAVAGSTVAVELTAAQRADIERGVERGLADPNAVKFGRMTAKVSRFTSQSYIVCGWVKPAASNAGYEPFVAMYVPKTKNALLIGMGGRQPQDAIRERCIAEGVPLDS
jgi:hypothetical protein